jgi:putative heme-binding domain-containing protein
MNLRAARICPWIVLVGIALAGRPVAAQHETAADIEDGGRAFRDSCANCHGPDGNEIPGIDLGRAQFRRALSNEELVRIIRIGIPGTPMPPTNVSEEQAARIVAYLRSTAASRQSSSASGNPERGQALFEGVGTCTNCHRVNGKGSRLGPDLSNIGRLRRALELETSIVEPDTEILPPNRFYRVVTRDGVTTTGRLLNLDTFSVQLIDGKEQLRSFDKSNLREHGFIDKTPMPSYQGKLSPQELADVVSYLVSLKGKGNP